MRSRWRRKWPPVVAPLDEVVARVVIPSPLELEEVVHYRWLLDGLLAGAEKLSGEATVKVAIGEARELLAELMARIETEVELR